MHQNSYLEHSDPGQGADGAIGHWKPRGVTSKSSEPAEGLSLSGLTSRVTGEQTAISLATGSQEALLESVGTVLAALDSEEITVHAKWKLLIGLSRLTPGSLSEYQKDALCDYLQSDLIGGDRELWDGCVNTICKLNLCTPELEALSAAVVWDLPVSTQQQVLRWLKFLPALQSPSAVTGELVALLDLAHNHQDLYLATLEVLSRHAPEKIAAQVLSDCLRLPHKALLQEERYQVEEVGELESAILLERDILDLRINSKEEVEKRVVLTDCLTNCRSHLGDHFGYLSDIVLDEEESKQTRLNALSAMSTVYNEEPRMNHIFLECLVEDYLPLRLLAIGEAGVRGEQSGALIPSIIPVLFDNASVVRVAAARALGNFAVKSTDIQEELFSAIKVFGDDAKFRMTAIRSIGVIGDRQAIPGLNQIASQYYNDEIWPHVIDARKLIKSSNPIGAKGVFRKLGEAASPFIDRVKKLLRRE